MKIIVTHSSPDLDAITSVWAIKRFLPGWSEAKVEFVPAGERSSRSQNVDYAIEKVGNDEMIHVDTGLGPLDHHQTSDDTVCGASRSWDFAKENNPEIVAQKDKKEAIDRIVKIVVDADHFKEVFWADPTADYHEFSILGVLDGLKLQKPDDDAYYVEFIMSCLDALLHQFQNRIWAEKEIADSGIPFSTKYGRAIGFETINDSVVKLSQKMGYMLVVRRDPRKGYVRIKAKPPTQEELQIDLTLAYEKLKKIDPDATWYLHVSKKMLLNGSVKNPKMRPSSLSLNQIIEVLKQA